MKDGSRLESSAPRLSAVSLFSCGGIGDLALRAAGFDVLVSNELLEERHQVFEHNFPLTKTFTGDVNSLWPQIVQATEHALAGRPLTLLYATPPCQGMSKNGRGKLLNRIRSGQKPSLDERNRLIVATMKVAVATRPDIVLLENVPEMANTAILDDDDALIGIIDYVRRSLGDDYVGHAEVVEFADYGVPQRRQRLITVFTRSPRLKAQLAAVRSFMPPRSHGERPDLYGIVRPWVSVREALAGVPTLDAARSETATSGLAFHRVPVLDRDKYWWVSNTRPGRSAFDNQCVACDFENTPTHSSAHDAHGVNRASTDTPLHCLACGALLPRPSVNEGGSRRLMRGFTSAYKRMDFDKPSSALTRNLSYACSDNKLHPVEHRVLSLFEAFRLHTVDQFDYQWERRDGRRVSDKTIREMLGESIPPAGFVKIVSHLRNVLEGQTTSAWPDAGPLFDVNLAEPNARRSCG